LKRACLAEEVIDPIEVDEQRVVQLRDRHVLIHVAVDGELVARSEAYVLLIGEAVRKRYDA